MKFFITGISGFIAKHLAKRLIEQGHEVDCTVHGTGLLGFQDFMNEKRFQVVDSFQLRTKKYDYIIHMAATTSIKPCFNQGIWFNNAVYAEYIMNQPFRTIYASSTSAYECNNVYAHSKVFLESLGERHGNALGLRLFNVYGPGNNKGIVKRVIDCCLSGETLTLQGGDQVRDFIYVDDVVDIIIGHLDNPLSVMDVGTGVGTRIRDMVRLIINECHEQGILSDTQPFIIKNIDSDLFGEQLESIAHSNPVKDYTPLREGIRKTIEETLK